MAYCTQSDILKQIDEDVLIQLTDDADAGTVNTDNVDRAISRAEAEIDSYCGMRYEVPFTTVPDRVRDLAVDIAIYRLYGRRKGAPENRKNDYDDAVKFLRDVAQKKASLGENDPDSTPSNVNAPDIESSTKIFSRDDMSGF